MLTVKQSTNTIDKLEHVKGTVTGTRIIKHTYSTKRKVFLKNVLVLSVDGTNEEFGFVEDSDAYKKLLGFREVGKSAKIYYDSSGKRIEQGVTLHIYDLKIDNYQVVNLSEERKRNLIMPIIFFTGALIILIVAIAVIKSKEHTQLNDASFSNDDD